jgi:CheY-like chemotaxis protein
MDLADLLPSGIANFWPGVVYRPESDLFVGIAHAESIIVVSVHPETCVIPLLSKSRSAELRTPPFRLSLQECMPETKTKPKVLVVDDERVIADTLAMILNQSGFEARAVYSGEGALEMVPTFGPDMLISDVIMADLNGIDAAIRIREKLPKIKILLFSGQAATADLLEKARTQGYEFEILAKPVHPQDLLSRLRA